MPPSAACALGLIGVGDDIVSDGLAAR